MVNSRRNCKGKEGSEINPMMFSVAELILGLNQKHSKMAMEKRVGLQMSVDQSIPYFLEGDGNRVLCLLDRQLCYFLLGTLRGTVTMAVGYMKGNLEVKISVKGDGIWEICDAYPLFLKNCQSAAYEMGGNCLQKTPRPDGFEIGLTLPLTVPAVMPEIDQGEAMVQRWLLSEIEMSDLAEEVLKTVPERMVGMKEDLRSKNLDSLKERVHGFKGIAGNFHMEELYEVLVVLDRNLFSAQASDLDDAAVLKPVEEVLSAIPERFLRQRSESRIEEKRKGEIKILVADDAEENRHLIRRVLRMLPVHITEASNGKEALAFLEEGMFDVLLLDMQMPVLDGLGVLNAISENGKPSGLAIYAMSASQGPEESLKHISLGCDGSLPKPVNKEALCDEIQRLLKKKR